MKKYNIHLVLVICFFSIVIGCIPNKTLYEDYESETLKIERVNANIFQHTSYLQTRSMGKVGCNGMIYFNGDEAIVFDTPINDDVSFELINWIGDKNIKALVVTHFHVDCLGGLGAFHTKGVPSYATSKTIELAKEHHVEILPKNGFENNYRFKIGNEVVMANYFGQGHTKDNIVGYIPSEKALFGGCLIKCLNAPKGNLADANVFGWPITVKTLKENLPDLEIVIPGHGKRGGPKLLEYTIDLFEETDRVVFFLHNRFLETHELNEVHSEYGRVEYKEVLAKFKESGFKVVSEKRNGNVNARDYAEEVVQKIDSLIKHGTAPNKITVVGTSKGGYIAQYVSTLANNPDLNFVFIASFQERDLREIPEINFCGNILTIYEKSDPSGVSAMERKRNSTCVIENFKEIEINSGLGHGFLFKPLEAWIAPTIKWAKGNYNLQLEH